MSIIELESLEDRLAAIRTIVQKLPQANFNLLRRVSEHLDKCVYTLQRSFFSSNRFDALLPGSPTLKNKIK